MVISKWPDNAEALKIRFFCCRLGDCDKRVVLPRSRIVAYSMAAKALHSSITNRWRTFYGSSAVLKPPRDCTMLGSSMRRVGLIDITVGDAPRQKRR